jgi:hypothetical protein
VCAAQLYENRVVDLLNTERPINIVVGTNKLTRSGNLANNIEEILENWRPMGRIPQYWDGATAERVPNALLERAHSEMKKLR